MNSNHNYAFSIKLNQLVQVAQAVAEKYSAIAIYGNGTVCNIIAPLLKNKLVGIVDINAKRFETSHGVKVLTPDRLNELHAECVIISVLGREESITQYINEALAWNGDIEVFDLYPDPIEEFLPSDQADQERMQALHQKFKGKRCFIVGNGPSLNHCNLSFLKNEFTFGVNGIFYKTRESGFRPTFYMVEDNHVIDDNLDQINAYECPYKFFPAYFKGKIKATENTYFFGYDRGFYIGSSRHFCSPRFSLDAAEKMFAGQTVTYLNLQLAYYLGFSEIYLIGVDFSYALPKTTIIEGNTYISQEDDPNHFHPDYFGRGKKWHDPKLDRVLKNYLHAKEVLGQHGVKIYNATKGGQLEVYPRVDYDNVFSTGL